MKVLGSSNYHCKLVSPLLSSHGLEKSSGRARPLHELTGQPEFQCSVLAPYTFRLSVDHLETPGYGRDTSGSAAYLRHTLQAVTEVCAGGGGVQCDTPCRPSPRCVGEGGGVYSLLADSDSIQAGRRGAT